MHPFGLSRAELWIARWTAPAGATLPTVKKPPALLAALLLTSSPAAAFVRTKTSDGRYFLWWPSRQVPFRLQADCALRPEPDGGIDEGSLPPEAADAGEDAGGYRSACEDAVLASFAAWQNAGAPDAGGPGCTDLALLFTGETNEREVGIDLDAGAPNGNLVLFQPRLCDAVVPQDDPCWATDSCDGPYGCFSKGAEVLALTTTTYDQSDGALVDADIEVNDAPPDEGGFDFSAEPRSPLPGTMDVEDTITHEAGHFLGLAHNCGEPGAPACTPTLAAGVMYFAAEPGETVKRTLKPDDIAGVCHIYPRGRSTAVVNLFDMAGSDRVEVDGCGTPGAAALGPPALLVLLLLRRRPKQPVA